MESDIHHLNKYFEDKLKRIEKDPTLSSRNKELILNYLRDSQLGKTIKKGQKREIGSGRNLQTASFLMNMVKEWFKKDLDKVTLEDMEKFILDLNNGKIQTWRNNKDHTSSPYSSETKSNIKKFIRKFYKWLFGNNITYPELVDWIDTSKKNSEIEAISNLDKGVWEIVSLIPDLRKKALVWVTFDSGFREGEIINVTLSDVEKNKDGIYYITCRESKTKPRTVSLPLSSELLDKWISQHPHKDNLNSSLWLISRRQFYKTVKIYGKKALQRDISVHMLRHTAATYYAPKLDRTTFCKRFGWSYASKSPDRYIDFAKVSENKVVDIIKADKYHELKKEFDEQKIQNELMKEKLDKLIETNENLENESLLYSLGFKIVFDGFSAEEVSKLIELNREKKGLPPFKEELKKLIKDSNFGKNTTII